MNRFGRLVQLIGLNAVPVAGLTFWSWSDGTALALYWFETVAVLLLVALRIRLHRKLTNKRGHFTGSNSYYSRRFLTVGFAFLLVPSVFVAIAIHSVDWRALARASGYSAAFLLSGFFLDLPALRERPFMWIRKMSDFTWWRVVLVDTAGLIGTFGLGFDFPRAGVVTFIVLKMYTDFAANWTREWDPRKPPRLLLWLTKDDDELTRDWEAEYDDRHQIYIEDEEPFDGRRSRPVTYQMGSDKDIERRRLKRRLRR